MTNTSGNMLLVSIAIAIIQLAFLSSCSSRLGSEGRDGTSREKYESPEAAFRRFQQLIEGDRWWLAAQCLSKKAREQVAAQLLQLADAQSKTAPSRAAGVQAIKDRHGLEGEVDGPDITNRSTVAHARDLPSLISELANHIHGVSDDQRPVRMVEEAFTQPSLGRVRTEQSFAVAEVLVIGETSSPPVTFEFVDDGWMIADLVCEDASSCPEAVFHWYSNAFRSREWKELFRLLTPDSQIWMTEGAEKGAKALAEGSPEKQDSLSRVMAGLDKERHDAGGNHRFVALMKWIESHTPNMKLLTDIVDVRLTTVEVDGDEAVGVLLRQERVEPEGRLVFRRMNGKWYLDLVASKR